MAAPPAYSSSHSTSTISPSYAPSQYKIGNKTVDAFLTVDQLRGHLAFINSSCELRKQVDALSPNDKFALQVLFLPPDNERKWSWFVGLAVERFILWCQSLEESDITAYGTNILPPPDVLMVFHAYLLNPGWFREDCHRLEICKHLSLVAEFLGDSLGQMPAFFESSVSAEREKVWVRRCKVPFDPFESLAVMTSKTIECPKCSTKMLVPYANLNGTGYLQHRFSVTCTECSFVINKDILGMVKMAQDLGSPKESSTHFLAGALWTPETDLKDTGRAKMIRRDLDKNYRPESPEDALKRAHYDPERMHRLASNGFHFAKLWDRIISAYVDDKPFSVELVGAVLRQNSFNSKMQSLGWTRPGVFQGDEERVLVHCIARYHAFLDLLSTVSQGLGVPTLDIDLAWHTHQLMPSKYRENIDKVLKRFLDHDDKILESTLETAFDSTSRVWQKRFGTRYTHCGCPVPGDSMGSKLGKLMGSSKSDTPSPFLSPDHNREDMAAMTHPSDHNAVYTIKHRKYCDASRAERTERDTKRREKELKAFLKKKDSAAKDDDEMAIKRRLYEGHHPAFLTPIPMEEYEDPKADCASFGGDVVLKQGGVIGAGSCQGGRSACGPDMVADTKQHGYIKSF
ncbi:hypothetical protein DL96DRAFT_1812407 [Flagelloscypha sp. PMI_526]|nr:hypothetical protein DL96DRAFT_1812407 [Flagelloscypha sp. PMI_526]